MALDERLTNVGVIGAAGKMGSGIALLIAQEMTMQRLLPDNKKNTYELFLVDLDSARLEGLLQYLRTQAVKLAEKSIVPLRKAYKDRPELVENHEIISQFVDDFFLNIRVSTDIEQLKNSRLVFEAVLENADLKISLLKKLKKICPADTFFLTNTSSIPINFLDKQAGLSGRIIGYHFYNPPAVQKLVEVISPDGLNPELHELAMELGKRLRKILIPSNDVAGFIGNGHFMRDGLYALQEVDRLQKEYGVVESIYIINRIAQDFLIRPMGIFQLIDYVGIDVFQCILQTMNPHFPKENLHSTLVDKLVKEKVLGGQNPDGSQKDGFLKYEKNRPAGVYDPAKSGYRLFEEGDWKQKADEKIGNPPQGFAPWRALLGDPRKEEKLVGYFRNLKSGDTPGARLAMEYLGNSRDIARNLVKSGVARSEDDVNGVLLNGFYHLYGPINQYV